MKRSDTVWVLAVIAGLFLFFEVKSQHWDLAAGTAIYALIAAISHAMKGDRYQ